MKSRRKLLFGLLGLTLGCLWLAACLIIGGVSLLGPTAYNLVLSNSSLRTGEIAPDFELPTLTGKTVRLSDFRGQPVLLTIGASWCIDCRNEAPMLQAVHESFYCLDG
jgi:thiol-disulfide isomerase/thioredoxin